MITIETSKVSFSLFPYFTELFFNLTWWILFCASSGWSWKNTSSGATKQIFERTFKPFLPEISFQTFFSLISYLRNLFFKSDTYQAKELSFAHLLVVTTKKINLLWREYALKKILLIFWPKSRLQTWLFHFFSAFQRHFFSNLTPANLWNSFLCIFCCN